MKLNAKQRLQATATPEYAKERLEHIWRMLDKFGGAWHPQPSLRSIRWYHEFEALKRQYPRIWQEVCEQNQRDVHHRHL